MSNFTEHQTKQFLTCKIQVSDSVSTGATLTQQVTAPLLESLLLQVRMGYALYIE